MNSKEYREAISRQQPESEIQKEIKEHLESEGYYVMRLNSGSYSLGEGRGFVKGQELGTPDLMAFREIKTSFDSQSFEDVLELFFIEVKRPGKKPTELQQQKMKELERYGARCIVAHSVEELKKQL